MRSVGNYLGNLHILVNDVNLAVICRNIVLLLVLGTISDEVIAADVALHFWYSAFIPAEYIAQISSALVSFLRYESCIFPLGLHSTLSGHTSFHCLFPLLAKSSTTVIVGYFMNWVARQEDGRAEGVGSLVFENLTKRMMSKIMVRKAIIK